MRPSWLTLNYREKLDTVKVIVIGTILAEKGFYRIENQEYPGVYEGVGIYVDGLEILINKAIPQMDYYELTAIVTPVESEGSISSLEEDILYLYKIEGQQIERRLKIVPTAAGIWDDKEEKEDVVDELISILVELRESC